jgi:hypothetical protein
MRNVACTLLLATLGAGGAAVADTLIIERVNQEQATAATRPARGISMDKVSSRWGAPLSKSAAVGQPPITRWEYGDFTVYFEYSHVIHAVPKS